MPKQPHEMSADEYHQSKIGTKTTDSMGRDSAYGTYPHHKRLSEQAHQEHVRIALANGLKVSPKAIASHPGLHKHLKETRDSFKQAVDTGLHYWGGTKKMTRKEKAHAAEMHQHYSNAVDNLKKQTSQHSERAMPLNTQFTEQEKDWLGLDSAERVMPVQLAEEHHYAPKYRPAGGHLPKAYE